jgi:SAM-dependent methyltransferase
VLLYLVWHHVPDRAVAAAEIRRVLRPGGRVLMRSTFSDRMPQLVWHTYFPRAAQLEREIFPTTHEVLDTFAQEGLRRASLDVIRVSVVETFAEYAQRLHTRAISIFEHLTEDEIESGFARLDADVAADRVPGRLAEDGDLLVLELPPGSE